MNRHKKQPVVVRFHLLLYAIALMSNAVVYAQGVASPNMRINAAGDKFDGVIQVAAVFEISTRRFLRADHIELAVGPVSSASGNEAFMSIGPVWRTPLANGRVFAEVGIAPTFFSRSRHGGRELGGHFHFTSFFSAGMRFGQRNAFSLRVQHISNGGLSGTNPGMDMVGLEYSFDFSE